MRRIPARSRPMHDEDDPADHPQGRQVVGQRPGDERRRDAEEREDGTEPGHVGEGVAHGQPARRAARPSRAPATAIAVSWPR